MMMKHLFCSTDGHSASFYNGLPTHGQQRTGLFVSLFERFRSTQDAHCYVFKVYLGCSETFNDEILRAAFLGSDEHLILIGEPAVVEKALKVLRVLARCFRIECPAVVELTQPNSTYVGALIETTPAATQRCVFWQLYSMIIKDKLALERFSAANFDEPTLDKLFGLLDSPNVEGYESQVRGAYVSLKAGGNWGDGIPPEFFNDAFFAEMESNFAIPEKEERFVVYRKLSDRIVAGIYVTGFFTYSALYRAYPRKETEKNG